jgi:diguanylate cyclase (GGDEF)-like protein
LELKDPVWIARLEKMDYAFQPIVNIHTGNAFGFEALLRCVEAAGFSSIDAVFDRAWKEGVLHQVDLYLRKKAILKFAGFKNGYHVKLFYNLDNRLFNSRDYAAGSTKDLLSRSGYSMDDICFEISEKHPFCDNEDVSNVLKIYRRQGYKIAVDDCGTGFSGLQMLYYAEPDYVKIDRFFIQNLGDDPKKRLVVSTIVNMAHLMGSLVLAEGVETREEYSLCKEIGCDMIQGYFVQRPQLDLDCLAFRYDRIDNLNRQEKRDGSLKDRSLIAGVIHYVSPVYSDHDIITVLEKFRKDPHNGFFPVLNRHEEPLGIVRETAFNEYTFSPFGRQLLENPTFGRSISRFTVKIPSADIHSSVEKLIETYTQYSNHEGLIIVDDMKYVGILDTRSLLKIINEKNLTMARNQNPLTKLPGNTMIHEYFSRSLSDFSTDYHLIYFDFDNFKPYNDRYGFRNGDRLILLFADMLKKTKTSESRFVGHVGGDDFFMGIQDADTKAVEKEMAALAEKFRKNAESFYDRETLEKGYMEAADRHGEVRRMPLITVSTAILVLPAGVDRHCSLERGANIIAMLKKQAKRSDSGRVRAVITDPCCNQIHERQPADSAMDTYDHCVL